MTNIENLKMGKIIFALILFMSLAFAAKSQNPPDIKWKCIISSNFKIIFPSDIESEAQRIANTLEWVYPQNTKSLNSKPKQTPLVLFSKSMTSNAYAGLGPRMMGWYLNPPQEVHSLGSLDWVETLSLHEFRHIVQYAKNDEHFTRFMSILYGDLGQSMMRWTIPDWFFEGDAIVMESSLSKGGRGRMPEFDMNIRGFLLGNKKYTYDQAYLGSYKRYYPSHYHLGYPMTAFARTSFGAGIWDKVLERTSRIPFMPYAFGGSLKKYTGLNVGKLYQSTMTDLKNKWETEQNRLKISPVKVINTKKRSSWTNYRNPKYDKNGNIICIKQSLQKIAAFYTLLPDGTEKKIQNTDAEIFSISNNVISWESTIPDIRWSMQSFSDIMLYGQNSKITKRLTLNKKYMSPAISPDGKLIAAVEHNEEQKNHLCIIDALDGKELQAFEIGNNDYIRIPGWSADGKKIVFTHAKYNGTAISILDPETGKVTKVLDYSFENIGQPVFFNPYILYNSAYSGISNIYAADINTGEKYQVTSRPLGAFNADVSPDHSKIVFQDYTKDGYDIAEMELKPENWIKIEDLKPTEQHYLNKLIEQEGGQTIQDSDLNQKIYPVTKYNKFRDGIKIHSWGFFPYVPNLEFNIYADNYLNTLNAIGGYYYDTNEKTHNGYLGIVYSKYFPVFTLTSGYGQRKDSYNRPTGIINDSWDEFRYNLSISLPFNLSRNVNNTKFSVKGGYSLINTMNKNNIRRLSDPPEGNMNIVNAGLNFSNNIRYAWRDFNPRWAQIISMDYKQIAGTGKYTGHIFSARSSLYFPGLFPQHSLKLGGAYEQQEQFDSTNYQYNYYFSRMFSFPRGYIAYTFDKFYKFSADYQLPLWYPDFSIGPLAYLKRVRAGAFYDLGTGYLGGDKSKFLSFGGSLLFEFYVFRFKYPLEMGVQYAYHPNDISGGKKYEISVLIFGLPF